MEKVIEKWEEIINTVKKEHELSEVSFDTWIRPLEVYGIDGNKLYILVPSEQMGLMISSSSFRIRQTHFPSKEAIIRAKSSHLQRLTAPTSIQTTRLIPLSLATTTVLHILHPLQ